MESAIPGSISLGILVEKEVMVQTVDNAGPKSEPPPTPAQRPSVVSVIQSAPDLKEHITSAPAEQTSTLPSAEMAPGRAVPRSGIHEERLETLADFFRSPPPPGNFMSVPDNSSVISVERRWSLLKPFRKKKKNSQKTRPPLIVLPDSAVSARTISGHRYIAISIPSEESHLRPILPTQFEVTDSMEAEFHRAVDARLEPIRSMAFDRGKGIRNSFTMNRGSLSPVSLTPRLSTRPEGFTKLAPPPRRVSVLSTVPSEETPPGKGKEPDKRSSLELRSVTPHLVPMSALGSVKKPYATRRQSTSPRPSPLSQNDRKKTPEPKEPVTRKSLQVVEIPPAKRDDGVSQETQRPLTAPPGDSLAANDNRTNSSIYPGPPPRTLSANPLTSLAPPVRTSSKRAGITTAESRDGGNAAPTRPTLTNRAAGSNNDGPRGSFAESLVTIESSPQLCKAETATAYQSVPIVVRPPSRQELDSPLNLNFPPPPSSRVSRPTQRDFLSPPPAADRSASRKDRVRERKQRDIENLKSQIRQIQSPSTHLRPDTTTESSWPESPVLGRFSEGLASPAPSRPLPTTKRSDIGPIRPCQKLETPFLSANTFTRKRRGRSASAPALTSSSSPSSLETPSPSMPWEGSTSYFRRREKQAEREEHEARRARYAAHVLAEEKEAQERISQQKLLRRYERLKESRAKDMDRRLDRLERNGEVLMKSLIDLMGTLNKIMQGQQSLQQSMMMQNASAPERSQSLRSSRSGDRILEILRSQPSHGEQLRLHRHRSTSLRLAAREAGIRRGSELSRERSDENTATRVHQTTIEALQEQLRNTQSQPGARGHGDSSYTSSTSTISTHSDDAHDREIVEPLLRELQAMASGGAEEGRTPLSESEVFNLF